MAKPKRMSELFASSTEREDVTMLTATPPYSSEGPTLPMIGSIDPAANDLKTADVKDKKDVVLIENEDDLPDPPAGRQKPSMPPSNHPALYEPWTLLPPELLELLQSQARLRTTKSIIPVVFSKNQNVKSGINRLKVYLGASDDAGYFVNTPDVLKEKDYVIAISAQGEGTTKLVGIVDMVRRIVAPNKKVPSSEDRVQPWWMYTMLTSIEIERGISPQTCEVNDAVAGTRTADESEREGGVEPMDIDGQNRRKDKKEKGADASQRRKVPVLTVWMTRQHIPAFKRAFGEHAFVVEKMRHEED